MVHNEPGEFNGYLEHHVKRMLESFRHWTGRYLVEPNLPLAEQARAVFYAPFVVLSHNTAVDPLLNYSNQAGLRLFELSWNELVTLPSRLTAEPVHRVERARLLATVAQRGYIDDYRGVRISKSGRRFLIERATVWNLLDEQGSDYGQAAMFGEWRFLD